MRGTSQESDLGLALCPVFSCSQRLKHWAIRGGAGNGMGEGLGRGLPSQRRRRGRALPCPTDPQP